MPTQSLVTIVVFFGDACPIPVARNVWQQVVGGRSRSRCPARLTVSWDEELAGLALRGTCAACKMKYLVANPAVLVRTTVDPSCDSGSSE